MAELNSDQNELILRRYAELEELRSMGVNPYPYDFAVTASSGEIIASFLDESPQRTVSIAGRIMSIRRMGKASFIHIQDAHGRIQVYFRSNDLPNYNEFKLYDIGDIAGVTGFVFRTKTGEITVHAPVRSNDGMNGRKKHQQIIGQQRNRDQRNQYLW